VRFPIIGKVWITTTSEMAGRVLKDSEMFTMRKDGELAGLRWWMPTWVRTLAVSMLTMDEPDHTRLRSIVDEAFRRRAILACGMRLNSAIIEPIGFRALNFRAEASEIFGRRFFTLRYQTPCL
jgi:cytochrome P450 PksS